MSDHNENGSTDGEYVPSPRPHPRLRPEGAAYAERNRGTMERWFDYSDNVDNYNSPRPGEKLRTDTARKIAQTNKGVMDEMMGGYPDPPIQPAVHPRAVKGEAAEIAESNKGGGMRNLIENYGNLSVENDRPAPKVKGNEASEYAERNHGKMDHIINNYGVVTPPERPQPKVSYGGHENLDKAQGADMGPLLRMEGNKTPKEPRQRTLHQESQGGVSHGAKETHETRVSKASAERQKRREKRTFESSYSSLPSRLSHSAREDNETRVLKASAERHESPGQKRPYEFSSDSSYSPPQSRVSHSAREDHETRIAQGSAERHESRGRKRKRVKRPFESSPILHTHHRHLDSGCRSSLCQPKSWDEVPPAHRIRPEGEGIVAKQTSDHMFDIMRTDNGPVNPVKDQKKPQPAQMQESTSPRGNNLPRTRPGEGLRNYERAHNQSEMSAILRGEVDRRPSTPARNVRHLQRSELW